MPITYNEFEKLSEKTSSTDAEENARGIMSKLLGIKLAKKKLKVFGKMQEFDLVNEEARIVGDVKCYVTKTSSPTAEIDRISAYVWFMEKLESSSKSKWRKIIVGLGNREIFESYKRRYDAWLGDTEIFFIDDSQKVHKVR